MKCEEFPNKKRYATKFDAETAALILNMDLKIYKCDCCGGWHLSKFKNSAP